MIFPGQEANLPRVAFLLCYRKVRHFVPNAVLSYGIKNAAYAAEMSTTVYAITLECV